jgi:hypothetical protein
MFRPFLVGVSPKGVEYVARKEGDAAILKARLSLRWERRALFFSPMPLRPCNEAVRAEWVSRGW